MKARLVERLKYSRLSRLAALPLRLRVRQSLHLLYCARVKRRLMPAFVLAEGKEVEMTGVLTTRS